MRPAWRAVALAAKLQPVPKSLAAALLDSIKCPVTEGTGRGGEALLHGACADGKRNGMIVGAVATRASGHAERLAARHLFKSHTDRPNAITLGADMVACGMIGTACHMHQHHHCRRRGTQP
jgi:hypothetical protein